MPRSKKTETGEQKLDAVLANIQKKRGVAIGTVLDAARPIEVLSSGNLGLDFVTGVWGFPKGRIVELYGKQSSGKSTAALQTAVEARRHGLTVAYFDYESATDPSYVKALGLDPADPQFIFATPDTLEDGMNALRDLMLTGELAVGVVDSVAAMVSVKEMEADTGSQSSMGLKARMMAQAMRQMTGLANKHGTILMFVNHAQEVIDTSPMGQRLSSAGVERITTPGGNALKFHATLRLHFKVTGRETRDVNSAVLQKDKVREAYATNVQVIVEKNKVGAPFRKADLRLDFGRGFSQEWSALQVLIAAGRVKQKAAGWYDIADLETGEVLSAHGEQAALDIISTNLDGFAEVARAYLEETVRKPTPEEIAEMQAKAEAEDAEIEKLLDGAEA